MPELYDRIGVGYRALRTPDARIEAAIASALGAGASVANVGAGSGSYEPRDRRVIAVEPSLTMLRQRVPTHALVVRATAEALPLCDAGVDAALAVLTVHHWPDQPRGLAELARVARRRVVLLTWDPEQPKFWLAQYFPSIVETDRRIFPRMSALERALGQLRVTTLPIPHDCSDGFLGAYWRRPTAYLSDDVRAAISTFARLGDDELHLGLARLRADLDSGAWVERFGNLLELDALDLGYRIVVAER
jgi:SAM-dependent methyltransferase